MDFSHTIYQFFFNLIPGSLFLIYLSIFDQVNFNEYINRLPSFINQHWEPILLIFVIISLFLGYLFQVIHRFFSYCVPKRAECLKKCFKKILPRFLFQFLHNVFFKEWKRNQFEKIVDTDKISFNRAKKSIEEKLFEDNIKDKKIIFYLMSNYLDERGNDKLFWFYGLISVFWRNIMVGAVILLIRSLFFYRFSQIPALFLLLLLSIYGRNEFYRSLYDSVLKKFVIKEE